MDFKDSIKQISERIEDPQSQSSDRRSDKDGFDYAFINALGYDVFNPLEVLPEMCCDIGTKKGEKIDYAIMKDGEPIILIECKHWEQDLNLHDNPTVTLLQCLKGKIRRIDKRHNIQVLHRPFRTKHYG